MTGGARGFIGKTAVCALAAACGNGSSIAPVKVDATADHAIEVVIPLDVAAPALDVAVEAPTLDAMDESSSATDAGGCVSANMPDDASNYSPQPIDAGACVNGWLASDPGCPCSLHGFSNYCTTVGMKCFVPVPQHRRAVVALHVRQSGGVRGVHGSGMCLANSIRPLARAGRGLRRMPDECVREPPVELRDDRDAFRHVAHRAAPRRLLS